MEKLLLELEQYMTLKNYAKATKKSYMGAVRGFYKWCKVRQSDPGFDKSDAARLYIVDRYSSGLAWQTINGDYSAIQMLYKHVLNREWDEKKLPRPRKEKYLPTILSKEEVVRVIECGRIFKHQVLMALLYGTGMRVGEAVSLKVSDINFDRMQVHVRKGKGGKDRMIVIPQNLKLLLCKYLAGSKSASYVFCGKYYSVPLSIRSAQHAIYEAVKDAAIKKSVSAHTFRHCYATHHLESGTDLVTLQQQMGHKHLKTTAHYIQLCMGHYRRLHHPINDVSLCLKNITLET